MKEVVLLVLKVTSSKKNNWWVSEHEAEYTFAYNFWIKLHLVTKLGKLIDIVFGIIFRNFFAWFEGLRPEYKYFLIYKPTAMKQEPIMTSLWFFALLNVCT